MERANLDIYDDFKLKKLLFSGLYKIISACNNNCQLQITRTYVCLWRIDISDNGFFD